MCGTARPSPIEKPKAPRAPKNAYVIMGPYGVVSTVFSKKEAKARIKHGFGVRYITFSKKG